jgi:hypothetical protein
VPLQWLVAASQLAVHPSSEELGGCGALGRARIAYVEPGGRRPPRCPPQDVVRFRARWRILGPAKEVDERRECGLINQLRAAKLRAVLPHARRPGVEEPGGRIGIPVGDQP